MSDETPVEPITDDLDVFSAELFGQSKAESEPASSETKDTDVVEDSDATETETEEDTLETENDAEEAEDEDTPEEDESEEKPKKKNRFQERIDELTAKAREAERREQEVLKRFEALEAKLKPQNETTNPVTEDKGPAPDDTNEDGTEKYPLGEFDPNYIRDLTKFTLLQEKEAMKAEEEKASKQKQYETERHALEESWSEKVGPAKERYPDFREKGEQLFDTFSEIDQAYGEYLTATLMSMDHGPDVLYYLANNLDEANKIVASGPTKATIALGRLEGKFADTEAEKQKVRPKVSKAPAPPTAHVKGTTAVLPDIPDDTEDLDAFSKKLFKKK